MGKNNRDYKIKDKNLTKNKKNAKLNKSIAFTLAGIATIGAGAIISEQPHEAKAMLGRIGNSIIQTAKKSFKISNATPVATSRALRGSVGAINSGNSGNNGTQFMGLPRTVRSTNTSTNSANQTSVSTNASPSTNTSSPKNKIILNTHNNPTKNYGKNVAKLKKNFTSDDKINNILDKKTSENNQLAYSQNGKSLKSILTTEGFFRK